MAEGVLGVGTESFQLQSKYIRDLYKSIDKGCDLPPPPQLTGPTGDILIDQFDPKLYKTIKKLNKHRKKLLKENKLKVAKFPARSSLAVPHLTLERNPWIAQDNRNRIYETPEVEVIEIVEINQSDNNLHELDIPDSFDDFFDDVPDQIVVNNDATCSTRNLTKIVNRKTIDELRKDIEKEKRLIILLEPLSANIPAAVNLKAESPIDSSKAVKCNFNMTTRSSRLNIKDQHKVQKVGLNEPNLISSKTPRLDELVQEIEKDKRLVILLEPLSFYSPTTIKLPNNSGDEEFNSYFNESGFNEEVINSGHEYVAQFSMSKKKSVHKSKSRNFKKKQCPLKCGAIISLNYMAIHLKAHRRPGYKVKNGSSGLTKEMCSYPNCEAMISRSQMAMHLKAHRRPGYKVKKKTVYNGSSSSGLMKEMCSYPNCEAMISRSQMARHLEYHKRMGNDVIIRRRNRQDVSFSESFSESKICSLCGLQYFQSLAHHMAVSHYKGVKSIAEKILRHKKPLKSVCCSICLEHFEDETSKQYFLHMKTHDLDWKISCGFCKDNFPNFNDYTDHIKMFHPYQCPILECTESFINIANLKEHMREKHLENCREFGICMKKKEEYMCSYCPKKYDILYRLKDHLVMHEDPDSVTCTLCPTKRIFSRKSIFEGHMISTHGEKTIPCTFKGCLKMFGSEQSLREHLVYHDPNSSQKIISQLKKHKNWWKDPSKIYKCTAAGCDKEFANSTNSRSRYINHVSVFHTEVDSSSNQEIFNCPIDFCPAKCESKKIINLHIKLEHTEHVKDFVKNADKKFKCSHCDRSYNYQHALKDHEISHTDPAQTTCEVCNKFYHSKLMKNSHVKEAHGSKEIKCSFPNCPSKFSTEVNLRRHIKAYHKK